MGIQNEFEERDTREKSVMLYSNKKDVEVSIDDFKLIKVIGRGAFGKVMLVQKKGTDDLYALKSIRKEDIIQKDQIEHTKTERKILEYVIFSQKTFIFSLLNC